jgi:hypothetical protein
MLFGENYWIDDPEAERTEEYSNRQAPNTKPKAIASAVEYRRQEILCGIEHRSSSTGPEPAIRGKAKARHCAAGQKAQAEGFAHSRPCALVGICAVSSKVRQAAHLRPRAEQWLLPLQGLVRLDLRPR